MSAGLDGHKLRDRKGMDSEYHADNLRIKLHFKKLIITNNACFNYKQYLRKKNSSTRFT